jgi:hypothetical protein
LRGRRGRGGVGLSGFGLDPGVLGVGVTFIGRDGYPGLPEGGDQTGVTGAIGPGAGVPGTVVGVGLGNPPDGVGRGVLGVPGVLGVLAVAGAGAGAAGVPGVG